MKIGDEVYVHGYVDEIRNDVAIIRNDGGYFGTVPSEVVEQEPKMVHRETLEQVMWERDVAIEQLKELGYGLGEKIRTDAKRNGE